MKRKISIFLMAAILISCMVVPVSASEDDNFVNVLDYCTANDSGRNYIVASNSSTVSFKYTLPFSPVRYVDMIIQTVNGPLSTLTLNGKALTIKEIKTNLYRVYGSISLASSLSFVATTTVTTLRINITHFKVGFQSSYSFADTGFISLKTFQSSSPYVYMSDADSSAIINFRDYDSSISNSEGDPSTYNYIVYAYPQNWTKYDTIDLYFKVRASSVTSLSVNFDGNMLPFSYSYFDVSNDTWYADYIYGGTDPLYVRWQMGESSEIFFHISVDLKNVNRTSSAYPQIVVTGQYNLDDYSQRVTLMSVVGTVTNDSQDPSIHWTMKIYDLIDSFKTSISNSLTDLMSNIASGFANIGTLISSQTDSIVGALGDFSADFASLETWISDQTDAIGVQFKEIREALGTHFGRLKQQISEQTTALQTEFTNLRSELLSHFAALTRDLEFSLLLVRASIDDLSTNLNTWILNQTSAIEVQFKEIREALGTHFGRLKQQIAEQTVALQTEFTNLKTSLNSWIQDQTNALESAIRGDTSPGDQFQDEVSQRGDSIGEMSEIMDSVQRPDNVDFSIDGYVELGNVGDAAAPLTVIMTNDLFFPIFMMSFILCTMGYLLYGKR